MWTRAELKERAKAVLKVNYWKAVLVSLIAMFVGGNGSGGGGGASASSGRSAGSANASGGNIFEQFTAENLQAMLIGIGIALIVVLIITAISLVVKVFLMNPLLVGCRRYFILCADQNAEIEEVAFAFKKNYLNVVKTMFLMNLYIFLWSLLLIIPGIIKAYEYCMIPYLLAENPDMDTTEAFALSKSMTMGDKWNIFVLQLSFFGWHILGVLSCCMAEIFYVAPYENLTMAQLYEVLKRKVSGGYAGGGYNQPVYGQNNTNPYMQ